MSAVTKEDLLRACVRIRWKFAADFAVELSHQSNTHVPIAQIFIWVEELQSEGLVVTKHIDGRLGIRLSQKGLAWRVAQQVV